MKLRYKVFIIFSIIVILYCFPILILILVGWYLLAVLFLVFLSISADIYNKVPFKEVLFTAKELFIVLTVEFCILTYFMLTQSDDEDSIRGI